VGGIRVYRRDGITFPFTARLQGIHIRANGGRSAGNRVVTR
jgi:hypothetical protein